MKCKTLNKTSASYNTSEDRKVLLLNASEEIISVIDWIKAVHMICTGKATKPFNYDEYHTIKTTRGVYQLPTAIVLVEYVYIPYTNCPLTRKNIAKRDNYICQYCGKSLGKKDNTIDHVIPKSVGGKNVWENLVACCKKCNFKKANKSLLEAKMKLLKEPKQPTRDFIHIIGINNITNKSWSRWIEI
jgi:5-methylcytosine-specific restriction endonuclease McrA